MGWGGLTGIPGGTLQRTLASAPAVALADWLFDQNVAIKFIAARQGLLNLGPLID